MALQVTTYLTNYIKYILYLWNDSWYAKCSVFIFRENLRVSINADYQSIHNS